MKQVTVPVGRSGDWEIERFEVSEHGAKSYNLQELFSGGSRLIQPGVYTRLLYNRQIIMSDTPAEMRDHVVAVRMAREHVLVTGLGLGMVIQAMLQKPDVDHLTVVELSEDVIRLVAPHYQAMFGDRLSVIHDDAFRYIPPKGMFFGAVWHDIWPDLDVNNLAQMGRLKRRFARRTAWQGCWGYEILKREQRRNRYYGWN